MKTNLNATLVVAGASVLGLLIVFLAVNIAFGWMNFSEGKIGYIVGASFLIAALTAVPCHYGVRMAIREPGSLKLSLTLGFLNGMVLVPVAILVHRNVADLLGLPEPFALILTVLALASVAGACLGYVWPRRRD